MNFRRNRNFKILRKPDGKFIVNYHIITGNYYKIIILKYLFTFGTPKTKCRHRDLRCTVLLYEYIMSVSSCRRVANPGGAPNHKIAKRHGQKSFFRPEILHTCFIYILSQLRGLRLWDLWKVIIFASFGQPY